ncbi:uncharacterized protein TNCV_2561071 [Trichonephila clavipes]|uniref:Uncharacterized protein n=1 Tax=Trichonephila clavipes TaxID=2585209 RepID=A0A8X6R162_TRICX|nr:uncharacterized protein TNCV_2561071 [Trichonephila clavipes]
MKLHEIKQQPTFCGPLVFSAHVLEAHGIHRDNGLEERLSLALALSTIQVTVRFSSEKFPPVRQIGIHYDRWRHHRFPPPHFRHGTGGEVYILQSPELLGSAVTAHKTFGPTDLTSTYSMCTLRIFGGTGHLTQAFRSGVRCSNHQATHGLDRTFCSLIRG